MSVGCRQYLRKNENVQQLGHLSLFLILAGKIPFSLITLVYRLYIYNTVVSQSIDPIPQYF